MGGHNTQHIHKTGDDNNNIIKHYDGYYDMKMKKMTTTIIAIISIVLFIIIVIANTFTIMIRISVLARIWIFFPKKELFKIFRELFAK